MSETIHCDVAILGGGLAGGLIALALAKLRPELDVRIIEAGASLGGNHVWSFFDSDIAAENRWLVEPLICHHWQGYVVAFPEHSRTIEAGYNSIRSSRFDEILRARIDPDRIIRSQVETVSADGVLLDNGGAATARHVIDARGPGDLSTLELGWQKFVGQSLTISGGHGLTRPIIMDATVDQAEGYRFVYCLPFDANTVFVEDTYYSDTPDLDVALIRERISDYVAARGWQIAKRGDEETGVLPIVIAGDFEAYWNSTGAQTAKAGLRAGLFQATTGYSLPDAVRLAVAIPALLDLDQAEFAAAINHLAASGWQRNGFYRMLDTMLFRAAAPDQRYRVLERFYTLSPALIARFYAGQSTLGDKIRVLSGKPPVSIWKAIRALSGVRNQRHKS